MRRSIARRGAAYEPVAPGGGGDATESRLGGALHDQDAARRVSNHVRGDAPEEELRHAGATVRSDHEEVRLLAACRLDQDRARVAELHARGRLEPRVGQDLRGLLRDLLLVLLLL